ncbi:MAG: benzoate/H(+) symporter BenE family transporter [Burkholderiales bacterium]|jgi:benzoate membrane transport protein|nr:benzoate/H(+) symporter BenE family transporter [Burkholderiales bacterium]
MAAVAPASPLSPRSLWRDLSLPALVTGFVTVLVGYSGTAAVVFEAARALGANDAQVASWMWSLGIGAGVLGIALSWWYRQPVVPAWSTPGAALFVTGVAGVTLGQAVGAFMVAGALVAIVGFSGLFARLMDRVPAALGAGLLAGVLLRFGLQAFASAATAPGLVVAMFGTYLVMRRAAARWAVIATLAVGIAIAAITGTLHADAIAFVAATPVWVTPALSGTALLGIALPLFVVTMASQNIPGVAAIRAAGYDTPVSAPVGWTGAMTVALAPFGGYMFNLAAITAAICMGREAHPDPARRYVAAMAAGGVYLLLGIGGATVGALFTAFPRALVVGIAGLALLGTIGNGLATAMRDETTREPALITFLVTASGVTLAGIGSAFWGLVAGAVALGVATWGRR